MQVEGPVDGDAVAVELEVEKDLPAGFPRAGQIVTRGQVFNERKPRLALLCPHGLLGVLPQQHLGDDALDVLGDVLGRVVGDGEDDQWHLPCGLPCGIVGADPYGLPERQSPRGVLVSMDEIADLWQDETQWEVVFSDIPTQGHVISSG